MSNRLVLNETSYHGKGAIQEIAGEVKRRGFKKAFVCSGPTIFKHGVTKKVTDVLDQAGCAYEVYTNIKENPTIENVQNGVEEYKKSGADFIIAIGGGSPMDTAKAIGIIINNPEFADVRSLEGVAPTKNPCVPIIAVPTTAGTAAEVTINYVITDVEKKRKFVCVDTHDIPVVAVVDPDMMSSMPKGLTAATGMDALTHAVEAYIGRSTTKESREKALLAVKTIYQNIETAYHDGHNHAAREQMLNAAYLAGFAFSRSYVGYVHAVAHSLGGQYNIPHGLANAVLLPEVLESYGSCIHKKLHMLGCAAGVCTEQDSIKAGAGKFIASIRTLNKNMGIPDFLSGIQERDIETMSVHAAKEANPLDPVPKLMTRKELEAFYRLMLTRECAQA